MKELKEHTDRNRAKVELGLIITTSSLHFIFENLLHLKTVFLAAAALVWIPYLAFRVFQRPGTMRSWGLRLDNLKDSFKLTSVCCIPLLAASIICGSMTGHFPPPDSFWFILCVYPLWGFVQQFLLNTLVVRNLRIFFPAGVTVSLASFLFCLSHTPDWPLMGLTFFVGLVWTALYLKIPNLFVLGLWHGILGTAAYYFILGRDVIDLL